MQQSAKTASKLAPWRDTALPEGLSGFNRPAAQRTRLRTVTAQERLQQEIGQRPRVVGVVPKEAACLRLVSTLAVDPSDD